MSIQPETTAPQSLMDFVQRHAARSDPYYNLYLLQSFLF